MQTMHPPPPPRHARSHTGKNNTGIWLVGIDRRISLPEYNEICLTEGSFFQMLWRHDLLPVGLTHRHTHSLSYPLLTQRADDASRVSEFWMLSDITRHNQELLKEGE